MTAAWASPLQAQTGPFGHLHLPPEVVTTGSGEAIRFGLAPTAYEIRMPDGFRDRSSRAEEGIDRWYVPSLGMRCRRSTPESQALGFQSGESVELVIPRLESDPTAALAVFFDPRYWFRELTGRAVRQVPLRVSVDGGPPSATALQIHRTAYSVPRPQVHAYLPGRAVLERVAAGRTWTLQATGDEAAFAIEFPPGPEPVRAAAQGLLDICYPTG